MQRKVRNQTNTIRSSPLKMQKQDQITCVQELERFDSGVIQNRRLNDSP